jgi:hypothetical protein
MSKSVKYFIGQMVNFFKRERTSSLLLSFGLSLLLFIFFSILVSAVGFFLNIPISTFNFPIAVGLTLLSLYLLMNLFFKEKTIVYFLVVVFLASSCFFASIRIEGYFYDLNYDSQWYRLETVIALKNGWNPYRHQLTLKSDPSISSQNILNSYPKAQEVVEAVIYKFTGKMETGKSFNLLTIIMSFSFVLSTLIRIKKFNLALSIIGALLLASNPIVIIQTLNAYTDGSLYNLMLSLIALFLTYYLTNKNYVLMSIILCISIVWNIKLTAILYSTMFFAVFIIYIFFNKKIFLIAKLIRSYVLAILIAVVILGFNPFITNVIRYGNPLYSNGMSLKDYVYVNTPSSLYAVNPIGKFIFSIFSKPAVIRGSDATYQLKLPFTISNDEWHWLASDNTVSGFGPFFSGIFIVSIVGTAFILKSKHSRQVKTGTLLLLLELLISSVFFPVSSYARFIVFFWMFPCLVAIYSLSEKRLWVNLLGSLLIIVIVVNNYFILKETLSFNMFYAQEMKIELEIIKKISDGKKLIVDFGLFRSKRIRFKEADIIFTEKRSMKSCKGYGVRIFPKSTIGSKTMLCLL